MSHKPTPAVNNEYIPNETPERLRVRQEWIAWGKKAKVVKNAAQ